MRRVIPLACAVILFANCHTHVPPQTPAPTAPVSSAKSVYPDSVAGMQAQMDEMIRLVRMPDQTAFQAALDSLVVPQSDEWIAAHFPTYAVAELQQDYAKASAGYRSHVWWVMGNFAKNPDFALKVEPSELPEPLRNFNAESLLPRPKTALKIDNYRFSPISSRPPSWVSSFVYMDGRFRFVGGTYPFWNEKLTPLRGPMAIPAQNVGDLTVQAVPFDVDPNTPGVVALVRVNVTFGLNGKASTLKVKSGDPLYIEQAEDYIRSLHYIPIETPFPLTVVFFRAKIAIPPS